jgi:hypothetical protein
LGPMEEGRVMVIADGIAKTSGEIAQLLTITAIIGLLLFGILLTFMAGYFLLRVVGAYWRGRGAVARRERAEGSRQAREMAMLALICGPVVGGGITLMMLPLVFIRSDFRFLDYLGILAVTTGIGAFAGLIAGGAFRVTGVCLGRVRKTLKTWKRGGVWDADLDGLA